MGPLGVVKTKPIGDHPFRHKAIRHLMQIDRLVFEAAPQPFDENVVHGNRHASILERPQRVFEDRIDPVMEAGIIAHNADPGVA